jgi:hypothetical protein
MTDTSFPYPFTPIPNSLISCLPTLNEAELKILLVICRKTFGWKKSKDQISIYRFKPDDRISISQFIKLTGLCRQSVLGALSSLKLKNLIIITGYFRYSIDMEFINTNENLLKKKKESDRVSFPKGKRSI